MIALNVQAFKGKSLEFLEFVKDKLLLYNHCIEYNTIIVLCTYIQT